MPSSTDPEAAVRPIRLFELPAIAPDRILRITDEITQAGGMLLAARMRELDRQGDTPVLFVIDSPGGSSAGATVLSTVISFSRSPTIGLVITRAASAAFSILQSCDLRLALASSSLHTHFAFVPGSQQDLTDGTHAAAFVDWKNKKLRLLTTQWEHAVESLCRDTGLKHSQAREILQANRLMPAHEAFALGCIDGIV